VSEAEFLSWLYAQKKSRADVLVDVGDDLAALRWDGGDLLLVGIDQVLDGVHFDSALHPAVQIGRKAMNRNLSDCAAMACLPVAAVVSAALPRGSGIEYARELHRGLREAGEMFDCRIVGGDTSAWDGKLAMSVAIIGRSAGIDPITRAGAKVGDSIYVTGPLGGSILARHMSFTPRVELARTLASRYPISSMIDISDGLTRDLYRICQASKVSAVIESAAIPIHLDAIRLSSQDGRPAIDHALGDGEDYELIFTTGSKVEESGCVRIGEILQTDDGGASVKLSGSTEPLRPGGWDAGV
jgi:thiamine-monophosphate kinase